MRRLSVVLAHILLALLAALSAAAGVARAQSYGPDLSTAEAAFDCGHSSTDIDDFAFDDSLSTAWASLQTGSGVSGHACIGQTFAQAFEIRRIGLQQASQDASVSSVVVQQSADGSTWYTVDTVAVMQDGNNHYYDIAASAPATWWRLVANSAAFDNGAWSSIEIEMMELVEWPTDIPGPTDTPTITLTPSTTPSPTPDYFIEITATSGAPMRFERRADYGDLAVFGGQMVVAALLVLVLAVLFWRRG